MPDTVYAMHGIMSKGAEDDFDLGMEVSALCAVLVSGFRLG